MTPEQYQQLKDAGWDDQKIQMHALKRGIELPKEAQGQQNGILGSVFSQLTTPALRLGQLAGGAIAKKMGYSQQQIEEAQSKSQQLGSVNYSGLKKTGEGRGGQLLGEAVTAGSYLTPVGRVAKMATGIKGLALAGGAAGYIYDVGQNLIEGKSTFAPGMGTLTGVLTPYAFLGAGKALKGAGAVAKYTTAQITGLKPETISMLLTKPHAIDEAQKIELSALDLAKQLQASWKERMTHLSATGRGYETIRQKGGTVDLGGDVTESIFNKYGLAVKDGRIVRTSSSQPIKPGDEAAFNDFLSLFGGKTKLTADEILNARGTLDNMIHWDSTKSGVGRKIAQDIRAAYDQIATKQLPGLDALDKQYGPERTLLNAIRKSFFTPQGELNSTALSRIANITGKNKDVLLQKVEQLVPGMGQKAQIVMALNDIAAAGGQKVGTYARGAVLGTGVVTGNPAIMALSVFMGAPAMAVPLIKAFGKVRGYSDKAIQSVVNKLMTGERLTSGETVMYREAIKDWLRNTSPGDQLLDTKLGQKAVKYNKETQMGMSIRPTTGLAIPEDVAKKLTGEQLANVRGVAELKDYTTKGGQWNPQVKKLVEELQQMDIDVPISSQDELKTFLRRVAEYADQEGLYKPIPVEGPLNKGAVPETALIQEAKKYKTADEFVQGFTNGEVGLKFHITDDPNFKINTRYEPRDYVTGQGGKEIMNDISFKKYIDDMVGELTNKGWDKAKIDDMVQREIRNRPKQGGLMVTQGIEPWIEDGVLSGTRKYVAIIDTTNVPRNSMTASTRGFGNELYISDPSKARVVKVVPLEEAQRIQKQQFAGIEERSQLTDIWKKANNK